MRRRLSGSCTGFAPTSDLFQAFKPADAESDHDGQGKLAVIALVAVNMTGGTKLMLPERFRSALNAVLTFYFEIEVLAVHLPPRWRPGRLAGSR